jgi:pyruvate/2-oxoglutarate dehydrogenase complex dihydrolipoamide acyltransferase (E2) component
MNTREERSHIRLWITTREGACRAKVTCPFCGTVVWTSDMTLCFHGKTCPTCGAWHGPFETSLAPTEKSAARAAKRAEKARTEAAAKMTPRTAQPRAMKPVQSNRSGGKRRPRPASIATPEALAFAREMGLGDLT